jgi:hypothetical protein
VVPIDEVRWSGAGTRTDELSNSRAVYARERSSDRTGQLLVRYVTVDISASRAGHACTGRGRVQIGVSCVTASMTQCSTVLLCSRPWLQEKSYEQLNEVRHVLLPIAIFCPAHTTVLFALSYSWEVPPHLKTWSRASLCRARSRKLWPSLTAYPIW